MEIYLLKFSACLLVLWLLYVLLLERQKMHHFKRFYLLGAFATSLIIPAMTITHYIEPIVQNFEAAPIYLPIEPVISDIPIETETPFNWEALLWSIYGIGVLLFLVRFIYNLTQLYRRISKHEIFKKQPFIYVLLKEYRIPHSFFKYIFLNKIKFKNNDIPKEVILHEETHAKQLHSLDILLVELLQIVFWFHPLVYVLKHHIKLNHEFLADQAVLNYGADAKTYQNLLLQFSSGTQHQLSSAINYSSIKKRFKVMKTQTSKTRIWLSALLLLPIIAILFYSFAEREYKEKDNTDLVDDIQRELQEADKLQINYVDSANETLMQEYRDFILEYNKTNIVYVEKYERAIIIYDQLMSDTQRASVEKYPERRIPELNISKVEPRKPTAKQFEDFKNSDIYAIWIDGKHVPNATLNNYTVNDFVHVTGSIVHKNARSEKFPQPNQYHLYTKAGFKSTYQDAQLNRYKKITAKYSNVIADYLKGPQTDNSELKILKAQVDKIYQTFSKEELKKHNILPAPPVPAQKQQKIPTKKEVDDYNFWAKKIKQQTLKAFEDESNGKTPEYPIIKQKDLVRYVGIYNRMTDEQKQNSAILPLADKELKGLNFPPPPPPAASEQKSSSNWDRIKDLLNQEKPILWILVNRKGQMLVDDELATLKEIEDKLKKLSKTKTSGNRVYIKYDPETSKKIISKLESLVKKYDFKVSTLDVTKIPPPPPPPSKKTKGGPNLQDAQNFYNPSFLEYIVEMENEGASFYLDDKRISAEKAKSIAKNNSGKRTDMITQKDADGNYVVKLSSSTSNKLYARSIALKVLNNNSYLIDGIKATKKTFKDVFNRLHQDISVEERNRVMNIHVSSSKAISNKETWFIYNSLIDYGFYRIVTPNQEINRAKDNHPFAIESHISNQQQVTKKEIVAYNSWAKKIHAESKKLSDDTTWYPPIDEQELIKFSEIHKRMSPLQKKQSIEFPFPGLEKKDSSQNLSSETVINQQKATAKQVAEYNKLAKHYNQILKEKHHRILLKDVERMKYIYGLMSDEQRKNAEQFPSFPAPPPPPEPVSIEVIEEQEVPAPPPPPIPENASPEEIKRMKKVLEEYKKKHPESVTKEKVNGEVIEIVEIPMDQEGKTKIDGKEYFYKIKDGVTTYYDSYGNKVDINKIPPPPPPENPLDFVIRMAKNNAKFFYKLKPITSDKAIALLKKNPKLHINAQKTSSKEPLVYISNKPIYIGKKQKSKN